MPATCTFELSKPYEIYGSGESVDGNIILNFATSEYIRGIQIVLRGQSNVAWTEYEEKAAKDGNGAVKEAVEYRADEIPVQQEQQLMREGNVDAGEQSIPFSLQLPVDCPGSFEGSFGSIRYQLSVTLVSQTGSRHNYDYQINVVKTDDLNLNPVYKIPLQAEEIKTFCWLTCTEGRILFTLTTPFGAYVPMQRLGYTLRVENQSMSDVAGFEVRIVQKIKYTAKIPRKSERDEKKTVLKKSYDNECLKLTTRIFAHKLEIPDMPPTTQGDHYIIQIKYNLLLTAHITGCTMNSDINMPLHIGTVALHESLLDEGDVVELPSTSAGGDQPPEYRDLKPPSFSEATRNSQKPPSFESAISASAPPYESIVNERNRPFIGFMVPTARGVNAE